MSIKNCLCFSVNGGCSRIFVKKKENLFNEEQALFSSGIDVYPSWMNYAPEY